MTGHLNTFWGQKELKFADILRRIVLLWECKFVMVDNSCKHNHHLLGLCTKEPKQNQGCLSDIMYV